MSGSDRALRSDAARNRAAILDTAQRLTARLGTDVGMHEVARESGVAIGTVYRHWPTKQDLLAEVLMLRLDEVAARAEAAGSLEAFLDEVTLACVNDRPLLQLLDEAGGAGAGEAASARNRVQGRLDAALARLIEEAADQGRLKVPFEPRDVRTYLVGVRAALASDDPDAWRRHLAIYRRGLFG